VFVGNSVIFCKGNDKVREQKSENSKSNQKLQFELKPHKIPFSNEN
jgi:hypothetical protein